MAQSISWRYPGCFTRIAFASALYKQEGRFVVWQGGGAYTPPVSFIDTLNRLLGDPNEKELRAIRRLVPVIRRWEKSEAFQSLTLDAIPRKTQEFRDRVARS